MGRVLELNKNEIEKIVDIRGAYSIISDYRVSTKFPDCWNKIEANIWYVPQNYYRQKYYITIEGYNRWGKDGEVKLTCTGRFRFYCSGDIEYYKENESCASFWFPCTKEECLDALNKAGNDQFYDLIQDIFDFLISTQNK